MLSPQIEASSLSDVTQLASNPPKYPRNPTEAKREPLTLYIARVPGSKDIILTTLKPQLKNVTAEDVAASLYYLHLSTKDDARFLEEGSSDISKGIETPIETRRDKPLPRKPLPESSRASLDSLRQATPLLPLRLPSVSIVPVPRRKPIQVDKSLPPEPPQATIQAQQPKPSRPLGPRPLFSDPALGKILPPRIETGSSRLPLEVADGSQKLRNSSESNRSSRSTSKHQFLGDEFADEKAYHSFSITLIRRDPSSGAQWNIGTLAGQPLPSESPDGRNQAKHRTKKPYFDISICLTTPGYVNFRALRTTGQVGNGVTNSNKTAGRDGEVAEPNVQPFSVPGFNRHVRMEGSSFWGRYPIQHKRTQSDGLSRHGMLRGRSSSGSSHVQPSGASPTSPQDSRAGGSPEAKGYVFLSPWDGRCKFSTSSSGRSLRCKHTLPAPVSARNPAEAPSSQVAAMVSELRFNLPSSTVFISPTTSTTTKKNGFGPKQFIKPKIGHIRNKLSSHKEQPPLPPRLDPTSYAAMYPSEDGAPPLPRRLPTPFGTESSDEGWSSPERPPLPSRANETASKKSIEYDDDRLDLSIGQEKAGGGNRGKRAKLGKLIIHDEGFKMLDLLVAANMGVWWSVWNFDQI